MRGLDCELDAIAPDWITQLAREAPYFSGVAATLETSCRTRSGIQGRGAFLRATILASLDPGSGAGVTRRSPWLEGRVTMRGVACRPDQALALMRSAHFSPTMMAGALVLPDGMVGKIAASATRRPVRPWTLSWSSTTALGPGPMRQVPMG